MVSLEVGKEYKSRIGQKQYCIGIDDKYTYTGDIYICVGEPPTHPKGRHDIFRYFKNGNWMEEVQDEEYDQDIIGEL